MSLEDKIVTLAEAVGADVKELKSDKVDKVSGKGLSDRNFTQGEKTKLANIVSVTTKNISIPSHVTDPINAIDLGVSIPALVSPNEKAGMYVRDTNSALFSGESRVDVYEDYVQISAMIEGVESAIVLEPDDVIFYFLNGEDYVQHSLKEMLGKIDSGGGSGGGSVNIVQGDGLSASAVMSQYAVSEAIYDMSTMSNISYLYDMEQHAAIHALDPETATLPQLIEALQSATLMDYEFEMPPPEP